MAAKTDHRDIHTNSVLRMVAIAFTHRTIWPAAVTLLVTAIRDFFVPQFTTKYGVVKRRVVSVDHPLDKTIPFVPDYIETYLHFVPIWIKSLYFVYKEFGARTLPAIRQFARGITALYHESGLVYRQCQSTTDRPRYHERPEFRIIHIVDPHLHCVPSLHVLIVVYNALAIQQLIDRFSNSSDDYETQKAYVYDQALRIVESILFVKQHSVNCIPAALFAMTNLHPSFGEAAVTRFIDRLFADTAGVLSNATEIREFIHSRYNAFLRDHADIGGDYKEVLLRYLRSGIDIRERDLSFA